MNRNEVFKELYEVVMMGDLRSAIRYVENYLVLHPAQKDSERLEAIKVDYQMMIDYWHSGFKDPQTSQILQKLRQRMYVLYGDMTIQDWVMRSPFLTVLYTKAHHSARDWSVQVVKERFEAFVSEVALLELEPAHVAAKRRKVLYKDHVDLLDDFFAYILTGGLWTKGQGEAMEDLLLSPTVDSIDQQVIISAIMLVSMTCFDMEKFRTLVHVYLKSTDENVRQRALVGWVYAMDTDLNTFIYPEIKELVVEALKEPAHLRELLEMQKQIYYCMNAERDHDMIQREIMPDLLKGQAHDITRKGLEDQNEDNLLNDILHPDEEEMILEKMEAGYKKMLEMQHEGADIYFGGFSQMKRYPFFDELSNWFTPFYKDHPGVADICEKYAAVKFLKVVMDNGPFCNSDKYSFMLSSDAMLKQIPQNMQEMLNRGEAMMVQNPNSDEIVKPSYIRRIYLQDLYRFFRLHRLRSDFKNIFDYSSHHYLFFSNEIFKAAGSEAYFTDMASFLIKRKHLDDADQLLSLLLDETYHTVDYYLLKAHVEAYPKGSYLKVLELDPLNERALVGLAKLYFKTCDYMSALDAYEKLLTLQPDKKSYLLNKAVCLTNLSRYGEAEQILFRLNYEDADDLNVARILAWSLTGDGKYEQAGRLYERLMAEDKPVASDMSNYAFYLWCSGKIDEAANAFRRYLNDYKHEGDDPWAIINDLISDELLFLEAKGINGDEMAMMRDLVLG